MAYALVGLTITTSVFLLLYIDAVIMWGWEEQRRKDAENDLLWEREQRRQLDDADTELVPIETDRGE